MCTHHVVHASWSMSLEIRVSNCLLFGLVWLLYASSWSQTTSFACSRTYHCSHFQDRFEYQNLLYIQQFYWYQNYFNETVPCYHFMFLSMYVATPVSVSSSGGKTPVNSLLEEVKQNYVHYCTTEVIQIKDMVHDNYASKH